MKTLYPVFVSFITPGGIFGPKPGMTFLVLSNPVSISTGIGEIIDKLKAKYNEPPIIKFFYPLDPCSGPDETIDQLIREYDEEYQCQESVD